MAIFKNQSLRTYFTTSVDDSSASSVVLKYRKSDGTEGEQINPILDDGPTGRYYVDWSVDELDQLGIWDFWSYVVSGAGEFPGVPWSQEIIPEGQSIVSKDLVKGWLGITDTTSDMKIEYMIPMIEADYLRIRNAPWKTDPEGNIKYPTGSDVMCAMMIGYKLDTVGAGNYSGDVSSESIDSYSVSYGGAESGAGSGMYGYPLSIVSGIKKWIKGV